MILAVLEISDALNRAEGHQYSIFTQKFHSSICKAITSHRGQLHFKDDALYYLSFNSVNDAIQYGLEVKHKFKYVTPKHQAFKCRLRMVFMSSQKPKDSIFDMAKQLCDILVHDMTITAEIKAQYEQKNDNAEIDQNQIYVLKPEEKHLLIESVLHLNANFGDASFGVRDLVKSLKVTYGFLYRKLLQLTGETPGVFIKRFRLRRALGLLHDQNSSISNIAKAVGFSTASYFSECFLKVYGLRPSTYRKQHQY